MKLCRLDDEGYYPVKLPWEYGIDLYRKAMSRIFSFLDKDSKHAIICKIIHHHKKPRETFKDQFPGEPKVPTFSPWYCVRCGEKCEVKFVIDIDYTPWSDWKKYCKMVDVPELINEFTSIPRKDEKNFWSNIL